MGDWVTPAAHFVLTGYSPENCKWATKVEQGNNRRTNKFLEHEGRRMTMANWARELGCNRDVIYTRIKAGWSVEKTLTTPVKNKKEAKIMAITSSDILFKLSVTTGSAGNSTAQGNPNASIGKYISTTQITDATLNNLFDDISGDENAASTVDYRCFFVHNAHASIAWTSVYVWISAEVAGGASVAIGVDPAGATAIGSASAQAAIPADETTAPSGVSFSAPTSKGSGISIGTIAAGECVAIWVRRTAANTVAVNNDGATIRVEGDTTA